MRTKRYWFLQQWGPTTDNLQKLLFRDGDHLTITFRFWRKAHLRDHPEHRDTVFVTELHAEEVTRTLDELTAALDDR